MYKRILCTILIFNLILLIGCEKQSINDINTEPETTSVISTEAATTNKVHINEDDNNNKYNSIVNEVDKVELGESALVDSSKTTVFTACVKDTFITDNIFNCSEIMSSDNVNNIYNFYTTFENSHILNEDGTVTVDRFGNERVFLLVKLSIKNEADKEFIFNSMGFEIYDIKSNENNFLSYCRRAEGFRFIDIGDDYQTQVNHLTLQPGEEKEIVMGTPISTKLVKEYDYYNEGGSTHYENVITGGNALNNLYMVYSARANAFLAGAKVFKLNVENNEVVK